MSPDPHHPSRRQGYCGPLLHTRRQRQQEVKKLAAATGLVRVSAVEKWPGVSSGGLGAPAWGSRPRLGSSQAPSGPAALACAKTTFLPCPGPCVVSEVTCPALCTVRGQCFLYFSPPGRVSGGNNAIEVHRDGPVEPPTWSGGARLQNPRMSGPKHEPGAREETGKVGQEHGSSLRQGLPGESPSRCSLPLRGACSGRASRDLAFGATQATRSP